MKAALALAVTLLLACSPASVGGPLDGGADADADAAPGLEASVPEASSDGGVALACQDFAYAYCNHLQTCSSTVFQERFGTESTCESIEKTTCTLAILAPSSGQTAATIEACILALPSWMCTDFIYSQNRPPPCQDETIGLLPDGSPCGLLEQCASGYCALPTGQACGVCAPLPQPGASCAVTECPSGLSCMAGTCVAYADQGAACSSTQPCNEGLACAPGPTGATICQPGVTTMGAPCSYAGAGCDAFMGLACNAQTSTCEALQLVQVGQACGVVANQVTDCIASECPRGQCEAYVPPGGVCDLDGGPLCFSPTRCIVSAEGGTQGTCEFNGSTACP